MPKRELNPDVPSRWAWQDKWRTVATSLEDDQIRLLDLLCSITRLTRSKIIRAATKFVLDETLGLSEDPAKIRAHWESLPFWAQSQMSEEYRNLIFNLRKSEVK